MRQIAFGLLLALCGQWASCELADAQDSSMRMLPPGQPATSQTPELRSFPVPAGSLDATYARLRQDFAGPNIRMAVDPRLSQIIVMAPPTTQRQIEAALQAPERPLAWPTRRLTHTLTHVRWADVEPTLAQIGVHRDPASDSRRVSFQLVSRATEPVSLQVDPRANRLHLAGPSGATGDWHQVIQALDQPRSSGVARMVAIERADPQAIRDMAAALRRSDGAAAPALQAAPGPLRWGGDILQFVQQGDQPPPPEPAPEQPGAEQPGGGQPGGDLPGGENREVEIGRIGQVRVVFIEGLNVIVLRGPAREVQRVIELIEDIERQSVETKPVVDVVQLRFADNEQVAAIVQQIYDQVLAARQGLVSITPLVKPNAILLIGRPSDVDEVKKLIGRLDAAVPAATQFRVFYLKHIAAQDAATELTTFYEERAGLGTKLLIVSDFRSNSLIVRGSPRDLVEVAELLKQIDVIRAESVSEVRVFRLTNSLASEVAPVLQAAIEGRSLTTGTGIGGIQQPQITPGAATQSQKSDMLTLTLLDAKGQRILRSGILSGSKVVADTRGNALVVTAHADNMPLLAALIEQLDQPAPAEAQIKVFTIVNGDATTLVEVLRELFPQTQQQGGLGGAAQQATSENVLVPLRFTLDPRTNSIIAAGGAGDLRIVEAILLRLDESDVRERETTVIRLRYAPAADVANSINQYLTSERQVQQLAPLAQSPFEQIEREVVVVPEPVSNSLIVSATPKFYEEIVDIVEKLDARPPMVLIQVLIAEVQLDKFAELGVEWGLQDSLLFDRSVATGDSLAPGFNFNNQPLGNSSSAGSLATRSAVASQALSAFGTGRVNPTLGYGGLVLSAASDSVNVLLRALKDSRRMQILSRPQVMTLDNQPAFVQVGARVPRITSVNQTVNGTINSTVLENVGLLLGVTPRISPDGIVVMEIDAERSELGPESEGIPISINNNGDVIRSPQINTTTAQTTVAARNAQTIILGGLITKARSEVERKVPVIGEVPVLGDLFKYESQENDRSELLIIMTPYIVRNEGDMEALKHMETQRMSWCLCDVAQVHTVDGLLGNPHGIAIQGAEVIFPDETPTGIEVIPTPLGQPQWMGPAAIHGPATQPPPQVRPQAPPQTGPQPLPAPRTSPEPRPLPPAETPPVGPTLEDPLSSRRVAPAGYITTQPVPGFGVPQPSGFAPYLGPQAQASGSQLQLLPTQPRFESPYSQGVPR